MEWGQIHNFIWLWSVPAVILFYFIASARRKSQMAKFGELILVNRLVQSLSHAARFWKRFLILVVISLMVVALAQPHLRKKETKVERKGIDVMIAVDVSNSMLAKDIAPSRLEKAKLELSGLVDKLKGNRLGVVAFAQDAIIQCPLTLDRNAVKLLLSTVNPNLISFQGTDLGRAIEVSMLAFPGKEKDSKALILLTDGEDHGKNTKEIVKKAKASGLKIFPIGLGTQDGSTLPDDYGRGYKRDRQGQVVLSKINESYLKDIAKETGGVYFRSNKGDLEADRILKQVNQITAKDFSSSWMVEYEENYQVFLILAFILLGFEFFLSEGKRNKDV